MTKLLRKLMDAAYKILEGNKILSRFKPVLGATDEFFFGTDKVTVGAPHIRDSIDLKRYMITVLIAVLPCAAAGVYFFGIRVIGLIMVSYIAGGVCEVLFSVIRKKEINEGFLITGIIYPLILPPDIPFWMAAVGIIVGVVFGKEVFGGTGKNIFNPAMVGRIFLAVAFPIEMTSEWRVPFADAITSATPLISFKGMGALASNWNLLLGNIPGSVGETCKIAIILGGIFLIITKVANWRIPLSYLGTLAVLSLVFNKIWPGSFAPPLFQLLSGGLLFGAIFMATDPVTSPFTQGARWIYGILLGVLTVCIRGFSGYVEGVMFAIIFMNIFSPLLDQMILGFRFRNAGK
ncbi:MAG: RnfABCDGE type electron transport complex subunit D [Omnitrophica bacterium]|nr:RnfABCDGE type electron transport complex subunit D [Candidatus Omnitrophota bacterium]